MIINYKDLASIRNKNNNKKIVLCAGCFDLFHVGHLKFINEAKKCGDILVVSVLSDELIKKGKNINRPIIKEKDRSMIIDNLKSVDYTIISNKTNYKLNDNKLSPNELKLIEKYIPIIDELQPNIFFISKETKVSNSVKKYLYDRDIKIIMKDYDNSISTSSIIKYIENSKM